jgi:hypothetical protein
MGIGFLTVIFFLRGYEFGQVIPSGFLPIAISTSMHPEGAAEGLNQSRGRQFRQRTNRAINQLEQTADRRT